ncbi:GerMN domain-containing protein [Agromyces sp. G08B096]|uniref:GerMN domain-containing protein n=1 Tax=Agromyces sp. G08B096 TaxID=3156399 RepID=A0AAU7W6A8_9MICO
MRRRIAAASIAIIAALLAGCASIPSSGGVHRGEPRTQPETLDLELLASGPTGGETQEEILRGFIDAATDARNNYEIAREFLTPAFSAEWRADESATIDQFSARDYEATGPQAIRLEVVPTASLGPNGRYAIAPSTAQIPLDYSFEQVEGEWRISGAPDGILIDSSNFTRAFRAHALTFLDPTERWAVPDVRWFAGRDTVQTKIVRALLAGPAEWLDPGVTTAFPDGARLEADAVPVTNTTAGVDLVDAPAEDARTVQLMRFQLEESLRGVRGVGDVRLSLNGVEQGSDEIPNEPGVDPLVPARPVVFDGEAFGHLSASGETVTPIEGLSERVVPLAPSGASVGPGAEQAALRTADGVVLVGPGDDQVLLDPRGDLIVPAIDGYGVVWSVPRSSPDQLTVYAPDGTPVQLAVPWTGTAIAALQVSRDTTRVVALLADGARTRFVAASVVRDGDGVPVELGKVTLELADVDGVPLDIAWLDDRTVASLTSVSDGTRVLTQTIGGGLDSTRPGPVDGAELGGGNSLGDLRVRTASGDLETRSGLGWQVQASGILLIAAQQPD